MADKVTRGERYFVKTLLEIEMDGIPFEKKTKVMEAFSSNQITFENLQRCLNKIATWQSL